jgi:hypothetical protein
MQLYPILLMRAVCFDMACAVLWCSLQHAPPLHPSSLLLQLGRVAALLPAAHAVHVVKTLETATKPHVLLLEAQELGKLPAAVLVSSL